MKARNWMQENPVVVSGDTLLSEAKRLLADHNAQALPVVDEGRLRGLITRSACLRASHFVSRTENPDEFAFFANRLKVKDLMVRNPATVEAADTMEHCLEKGRALNVGQFPVMENGQVVGIVSANEVISLAAHFLASWERRSGVTLGPMKLSPGLIGKIADLVDAAGAEVQAIYPIGRAEPPDYKEGPEKKVIVRFHTQDTSAVVAALEAAGFRVLESVDGLSNTPTQH